MPTDELATISRLAALFGAGPRARGVTLGIGDDAAVLLPEAGRALVWTVDAQVDGRHFRRDWMTLEDIGYRAFVAAASDLSAMGAEPWCALSALALPAAMEDADVDALTRGQAEASRAVGCPIVGGNVTAASELSVTTTLLGVMRGAEPAVTRGGAKPGDGVWLAGAVGLARAGLFALEEGRSGRGLDAAILAFRRPPVNVEAGRALAGRASAAIDLSDGLAEDAARLAAASDVQLVLDEAALLAHLGAGLREAAQALGWSDRALLEAALAGGEDYALLATSRAPLPGFARIGDAVSHRPRDPAWVYLKDREGEVRAVETRGFDHFARR